MEEWPSGPWKTQRNLRRVRDQQGGRWHWLSWRPTRKTPHPAFAPSLPIHGASPKLGFLNFGWRGLLRLGGRSGPISVHTIRALGKLQLLQTLLLWAIFFDCDYLLLSGPSWSSVTQVHSPLRADQVTPLLQPLCLSLNELSLIYLIASEQNVVPFPQGPVLESW